MMRNEKEDDEIKYSLLRPFKDSIQNINKSVQTPFDILEQPKYKRFYLAKIIDFDH